MSAHDIFLDTLPCRGSRWSVRDLLEFSYLKGINEAYEGTGERGAWEGDLCAVDDLGLDWLGREDEDDEQSQ